MRLVTGDVLWTKLNDIPQHFDYICNDVECDVLIIGGGITGAITAYYLTKEGIKTILVDKNLVGYGSTSASTAILQYEIDNDLIGLSGIIGEENAARCFKLCEAAITDIEKLVQTLSLNCDFTRKESLYYTSNISEVNFLKKETELRKKYGFNVEFIDGNQAKGMFSFPVAGAIYSKTGAAQINPYRFTHELIKKSLEQGLQVFENTEIKKINSYENEVICETQNRFKIKSKKVMMTTGYESKRFIHGKIMNIYRTFTIVTKPVTDFQGWNNSCIITDTHDPYTYIRTTMDRRIIIGGEDEKVGNEDSSMSNLSQEDLASDQKYQKLIAKLRTLFPKISNLEIEYAFSGLFGVTKDGLPYVGAYEGMPNCYFSLGFGSNGILYATMGGQLLRDLYLGNERPELQLFKFNR